MTQQELIAEVLAAPEGAYLDALLATLAEALTEDLESGAHWMNEAASAEFNRKYPRFTTVFRLARYVDWSKVITPE